MQSRRQRFHTAKGMTTIEDGKDRDKIVTLNPVQNPTQRIRLDRGCSWIICGAGFLIQCIVAAQGNISGIIFTALLDKYGASRSQTGKKIFLFPYNCIFLVTRFVFPDSEEPRSTDTRFIRAHPLIELRTAVQLSRRKSLIY